MPRYNDKSITLEDLARMVQNGFADAKKARENTVTSLSNAIEDLARMTQNGFIEQEAKFERKLEQKLEEKLEEKFNLKLNNFATKHGVATKKDLQDARDYFARVTNQKSGESITRDRVINGKVDLTADALNQKNIFSSEDASHLKNISPFN